MITSTIQIERRARETWLLQEKVYQIFVLFYIYTIIFYTRDCPRQKFPFDCNFVNSYNQKSVWMNKYRDITSLQVHHMKTLQKSTGKVVQHGTPRVKSPTHGTIREEFPNAGPGWGPIDTFHWLKSPHRVRMQTFPPFLDVALSFWVDSRGEWPGWRLETDLRT